MPDSARSTISPAWVPGVALLVGVLGAYAAWTRMEVAYTAEGRLEIAEQVQDDAGAWLELLRSYEVLDQVVLENQLQRSAQDVREASRELRDRLVAVVDVDGRLVRVQLTGSDPERTAAIVNSVMQHVIELATQLESDKAGATVDVLEQQLEITGVQLAQAEQELEQFRAATITLPSDRTALTVTPSQVPPRMIQEQRLIRRVETTASTYNDIRRRTESARLTEASLVPDLRILDRAAVPQTPSEDKRFPIAALILFACAMMAVAGSLVLDRRVARSGLATDQGIVSRSWDDFAPMAAIAAGALLALIFATLLSR